MSPAAFPLTFLPLLLPSQSGAQETPPLPRVELPEAPVVVPIDVSSGWPVVEVELCGAGPFPMILDTGAAGVVLDAVLAGELALPVLGPARLGDPSDPTANEAERVALASLRLGDLLFEELEGLAWERPVGMRRQATRGVVGLPLLEQGLVTFDYRAGELRFERGALPEPDGESVLVMRRDPFGILLVPIDLAGTSLDAHLDSGNARSILLPARLQEQVKLVEGSRRIGRGVRASGPVEFTIGQLDGDVRVGALVLARPEVRFDAALPDANLGATFFHSAALTLDLAHLRLRLVPYDAEKPGESAPGAGER